MNRALAIYAVFAALAFGACATKTPTSSSENPANVDAPTTAVRFTAVPGPPPEALSAPTPGPQLSTCAPPVNSAASPRTRVEGCLVEKGCDDFPPKTLPACTDDVRAAAVPIARVVGMPVGTIVTVRGSLSAYPTAARCTLRGCRKGCCNRCTRNLRLEDKGESACAELAIVGAFGCGGDESLTCCNGYPLGRNVIAVGKIGAVAAGDDANISTDSLCIE